MFHISGSRSVASVLAAVALVAACSSSYATVYTTVGVPISLADLNGTSSSVQLGNLSFYNFLVTSDSNDMPSIGSVTVTPEFLTVGTQLTTGFQLGGGFQDLPSSHGASDFTLRYEVKTVDHSADILDAHIEGNPAVFGTGVVTVVETFLPDVVDQDLRIFQLSPGSTSRSDSIIFSQAYSHLSVQKDILISVPDGSGSFASLSLIDQTYSTDGGGSSSPEPASLGILALGTLGLVARRRR